MSVPAALPRLRPLLALPRLRPLLALLAAGVLALAFGAPARAEVWGYVDDKGVSHFASEKVDERYELFFRGGQSFDTAAGMGTPRAVGVPSAASTKLIAFFEISPNFKRVQHHLRAASRAHDIDYELLKAVIATESGFDASAISPKGAVGLMQVMPATAQRYGVTNDGRQRVEAKLADPGVNIRTGTKYLRDLIDLFPGQIELALAAYNAGEGAVLRAGRRIPNFKETQNYVKTVMQLYTMLKGSSSLGNGTGSMGRPGGRVRMELVPRGAAVGVAVGASVGGAVGRGNLPATASASASASAAPQDALAAAPGDIDETHEIFN